MLLHLEHHTPSVLRTMHLKCIVDMWQSLFPTLELYVHNRAYDLADFSFHDNLFYVFGLKFIVYCSLRLSACGMAAKCN